MRVAGGAGEGEGVFGFHKPAGGIIISAMSVLAHGVDMVDCSRLERAVARHGDKFLQRVFTPTELDYCLGRKRCIEHLAGRFAAKEAVLKVLGTGWRFGISWKDIEVRNAPSGRPEVFLSGACSQIARDSGLEKILVSISHISTHAIASAVGSGGEK